MSAALLNAFPTHARGLVAPLLPLLPLLRAVLITMLDEAVTPFDKPQEIFDQYDFVVVGGGTAGSVVAGRLAEVPWLRVLLLEAGGVPLPESYAPGLAPLGTVSSTAWDYQTVPQRHALGNFVQRRAPLPMGRVVGGSSTTGGMVYTRGTPHDYNHWGIDNPGWDYESLLYYFRKAEDYTGEHLGPTESYHGRGGPLAVSPDASSGSLSAAFLKAGEELGYRTVDLNGPHSTGFTRPHYNMKRGIRSSTAQAYLTPALPWSNLHILHTATVTKILFESRKAVGVLFEHEGKTFRVAAQREVVLSAGAVASPKLLMLSGVGPQQHLRDLKIDVVADLAGVGRNLQDQVGVFGLVWTLPGAAPQSGPFFNTTAMHQYTRHREGPFSVPPPDCGIARVQVEEDKEEEEEEEKEEADIGLFLAPISLHTDRGILTPYTQGMKESIYEKYYGSVKDRKGFALLVSLLHPESRGSVTLQSADPSHPPLVDPQYLSHQEDVNVLVKGVQFALKLGNTTALRSLGAKFHAEPVPGCLREHDNDDDDNDDDDDEDDDDYWRCYIRHMASSFWQPSGTCRMGPLGDPLAVVDNNLRVHGVDGLRVVDAAVLPVAVSGGTAAATVMVAEKAADAVKADWGIAVDLD